jgi:hypothetical protein
VHLTRSMRRLRDVKNALMWPVSMARPLDGHPFFKHFVRVSSLMHALPACAAKGRAMGTDGDFTMMPMLVLATVTLVFALDLAFVVRSR